MLNKTRKEIEESFDCSEKLLRATTCDPLNIVKVSIPKETGVYLWRSKIDNNIVYVGRALGKRGLHQRIIRQHLAPSYSQSVLKRRIAEENNLSILEATDFLKEHFTLAFLPIAQLNIAKLTEMLLINEYQPKYNRY